MLTSILLIIVGMAGVFCAQINAHIFQGKRNLPLEQIRFLIGKKVLPGWIIGLYVISNLVIWIGVVGVLTKVLA